MVSATRHLSAERRKGGAMKTFCVLIFLSFCIELYQYSLFRVFTAFLLKRRQNVKLEKNFAPPPIYLRTNTSTSVVFYIIFFLFSELYNNHKVLIYIEHHSLCPLVRIGTPPPLQPQVSVPSPPGPKGGGAHSPAAKGVGESQFQRLEKRLALCLLCDNNHNLLFVTVTEQLFIADLY